ncbi:probable serine hydrolase isoform X2 [Vespa mandarinia]|uniref:probable serine hydrolase isoform X2 n=1 Tax=Vespa mandarinia TaxID=7446 RepID=UPI0016144F3F|nr:probable serine hydrolase isoform X2 [Vespa mandarinia]XP_035717650.1 probable serine hydrolase isoform X2 [Vespa mandarinia]XP_035717651.1 probable serine hydrolase isoform X2 [Vespa mandarinia]XP_035717652.1 probable serine hydrolase isoform X2 [Vespa mandarinia]
MDTTNIAKKDESLISDTNGYKQKDPEDIQIPVPWGFISGKWWGPRWVQPIVALHGRQDNAGSFDTLIPLLLDGISVLCLDMPGHGLSSHYPKSQYYYVYWDGVIILRRIVKYFKWTKVKLLGHSLGGAISFLYAASYPKEVDILISLDIVSPSVRDITKTAEITGDNIDKFLKYENLTLDNIPCYEYSEMMDIVVAAYNGSINEKGAEILMKRGIQPSYIPKKYYFSRDPRLKVSTLGMLSLDLVLAYASKITCAYLNIRAVPGMEFEQPENYQKVLDEIKISAKKYEYHEVDGTHHVHLINPEKIAPIINSFISN